MVKASYMLDTYICSFIMREQTAGVLEKLQQVWHQAVSLFQRSPTPKCNIVLLAKMHRPNTPSW